MDSGLAAESMEPGLIDRITNYVSTSTVGQWYTNAQYDDETIRGGFPGIRYIMHFHGGKCIIAGIILIGSYALHRKYIAKKKNREKETTRERQTTEKTTPTSREQAEEKRKQLIKSAKKTVVNALDYTAAQCTRLAHWIK